MNYPHLILSDNGANCLQVSFTDFVSFPLHCRHVARVHDYLWVAEDGMKMQGYNGSQLWDTAFSVQAIVATGLGHEVGECLKLAHQYVDMTQVSSIAGMMLSLCRE